MSSFMLFITPIAVLVGVTVIVVWLSVAGLRTYTERRTRKSNEEAAEQLKKSLAEMRNSLSPQQQRLYEGDYDVEDTGHEAAQRAKEATGEPASQAQGMVGQVADQRRATEAESWATFHRGSVFDRQGEHARAVEAYQQVIDSGHPEWVPKAAFNLGMLFEERGEYDLAKVAYQQVFGSGRPEDAPRAAFDLGVFFEDRGEYDRAEEAYQQVMDLGHPEWAPKAAFDLGMLVEERGEHDLADQAYQQAIKVYQQVIDSGHPEEAPRAAFDLGLMLDKLDEYNLAEQAYQQAINSGHPEVAPKAMRNLRGLTMKSTARESGGAIRES